MPARTPSARLRSATQVGRRMTPYGPGTTDLSGGDSFVAIVQSADLRNRYDRTGSDWLNRSCDRGILAQREVSPGMLVCQGDCGAVRTSRIPSHRAASENFST